MILQKRSGGDVWSYPNIHGDVAATADASGTKQGSTLTYDPFGNALNGQPDNVDGNADYGWLGKNEKLTEHETGLPTIVEMGARQYSPLTGRFLEVDPVEGGSANDYDYVNGDPINSFDLAGTWGFHFKCRWCRKAAHWATSASHWSTALNIVSLVGYGSCAIGFAGGCAIGAAAAWGSAAFATAHAAAVCRRGWSRSCGYSAFDAALSVGSAYGATRFAGRTNPFYFSGGRKLAYVARTNLKWGLASQATMFGVRLIHHWR